MVIPQAQKQILVKNLISEWESMKENFTRSDLEWYSEESGMDVRLQLFNGLLQIHTEGSKYDPNQGYWGYDGFLDYDWQPEEEIQQLLKKAIEEHFAEDDATLVGFTDNTVVFCIA